MSPRLIAEFGIIFVGVFGAFVAEDVRQQREDDQRAQQIYRALRAEVTAYSERAPFVVDAIGERLDQWQAARDAGGFPAPPFYREPRAETPPTAIWEATLASGGVALLDPTLFNRVAEFYNRLESLNARYLRYSVLTEREVLPHLDSPASQFYRDDGELGGFYATHVMLLEEIREEIRQLSIEAGDVDSSLASAIGS